jgi:hypothetical protein
MSVVQRYIFVSATGSSHPLMGDGEPPSKQPDILPRLLKQGWTAVREVPCQGSHAWWLVLLEKDSDQK